MSNSIGNLKNSGLQGNNFPWQLKMLQGLQAIYDEVKLPLTCAEDSIRLCDGQGHSLDIQANGSINVNVLGSIPVSLDCNDSITICNSSFTNDGVSSLNVHVTNPLPLEVNLDPDNDAVGMYGYTDINDPLNPTAILVNSAGQLDIRPLTCADEVSLCFNDGVSNVTVSSTNPLPVNAIVTVPNLNCTTDNVAICDGAGNALAIDSNGSINSNLYAQDAGTGLQQPLSLTALGYANALDVYLQGPKGVQANCDDAISTALCQTQEDILSDIKTAVQGTLDVNILSSIELEVNLDPNNDAVTIYGSNPTVPVSTDGAGHLQVDVLTIPEVEIKNDAGNPIPVSGTVTANQGTNPWVVGQLTHDNLNANANIQVNNTDVSATNPVPVLQQYPGTVPYASCEVATGTGTTPVVFSAGATSMSVQNIGNDNITVDTDASSGVILPPGVSITWDAPVGQRFDTFTFTGSSVSSLFIVTAVIAS